MAKAFFIIDVQNDFCEGGSLACAGGAQVASDISEYLKGSAAADFQSGVALAEGASGFDFVIASRDWHDGDNDNGGHFAHDGEAPDFVNSWPVHCVAGSSGGDYHANLDTTLIDFHIQKGQGKPAYSIFEGTTPEGESLSELLARLSITEVEIGGIATDYCVLASALDANRSGLKVSVNTRLCAGVADESAKLACVKMSEAGVRVL